MPVSPKSLANLRPAWTADTAPRGKGWPESRRHLQSAVGDGSELIDMLMLIARGAAIPVVAPDREPLIDPGTGRQILLIPSPAVVLGAIRELLDRAFGKPVQGVLEANPIDAREAGPTLEDLTDDEKATLRGIAHRRMLGRPS